MSQQEFHDGGKWWQENCGGKCGSGPLEQCYCKDFERQRRYNEIMERLSGYKVSEMPAHYRTSLLCLEHHDRAIAELDNESSQL